MAEKRFLYACPHCGSTNVSRDASTYWNIESQKWELGGTYDNAWCNDCDKETKELDEFKTKEVNAAGVLRVDQDDPDDWAVVLETGERVPVTHNFGNTVVAGPTKSGEWIATAITDEDRALSEPTSQR